MTEPRWVTGLFPDGASVEHAWKAALARGYGSDDMNVIMSDETRRRLIEGDTVIHTEVGNKAAEGAGIGGALGGAVGALAAALVAVGTSLVLPGLGLVVAGPVAAAFAGAGAGAAGGGLVGALIGWGIPEERIQEVESGLRNGGILVGLRPRTDDDALHFQDTWRAANGQVVRG